MKAPLLPALLLLAGCSVPIEPPDLNEIYATRAQQHTPETNPIIVIPGILGSKLLDTASQRQVWGAFGGDSINPRRPEDLRLMAVPMQPGRSLAQLRDSVIANDALDRVHLSILPGIGIQQRAYAQMLATLGSGGYVDQQLGEAGVIDYGTDHYTCFQFPYDWRRSSVENAALLDQFIREKKRVVEAENLKRFGTRGEVKFDIVAHSMGGLLTRYFLRYGSQPLPHNGGLPRLTWEGARHVDKVVLVATPNAGSSLAMQQINDGLALIPFVGDYPAALLGTMPAIYELFPRERQKTLLVDGQWRSPTDPVLWEEMEWGLANPESAETLATLLPEVTDPAERRAIALDHMRKCLRNAAQFHAALDRPAKPPGGIRMMLFAGDAIETTSALQGSPRKLEVLEKAPGDGTVARYSTVMDERHGSANPVGPLRSPIAWYDVNFLFKSHLDLTSDPTFSDTLLFFLLEM